MLAAIALHAVIVSGTVFRDSNGDGLRQPGEPPLAGVAVWIDTVARAVTDRDGRFQVEAGADGILWARSPDGYSPAPTWRAVTVADGPRSVELGLRPVAPAGPLRFVHASDAHIGSAEVSPDEARGPFAQIAALRPPPAFFTITGDVTQGSLAEQYEQLLRLVHDVDVPFVPVIGNHDSYDAGVRYREYLGPAQYSFDQGGVHVIVLDIGVVIDDPAAALDFVRRDRPRGPTLVLTHAPLPETTVQALRAEGVGWIFDGHWHSSRVVDHHGIIEVTAQPLEFGGTDLAPAGFRVATWTGAGFALAHHTVVDAPVLRIVAPRPRQCVPPGPLAVRVAAEEGAAVTVSLDGGAPLPALPQGGWSQVATVDVAPGSHVVRAATAGGSAASAFCVEAAPPPPARGPDWPQLQGSGRHVGLAAAPVCPPLATRWTAGVGGPVRAGSPVVADGRVFVSVADLGDATAGGVVALDAATGARLWDVRSGSAVVNAAAVADGIVVFASADGAVRAVAAASGAPLWRYDLGAGLDPINTTMYAAPTIAGGRVFAGVVHRFAALDLHTGRALWTVDPSPNGSWMGSFSAPGVAGDQVIAAFARGVDGIGLWEQATGRERGRVARDETDLTIAVDTSIVTDGETAWFGNGLGTVAALDLRTAAVRWQRPLVADGGDFSYAIAATPALAEGRLLVPTMLAGLVALDAASGAPLWTYQGRPAAIRPVHFFARGTWALAGAPVVTGETVWIGGADGTLAALDLATGAERWSTDLGAPILAGPAPSGATLYVATYDGTVQALEGDCRPDRQAGADDGRTPVWPFAILALLAVRLQRTRQTKNLR